MKYEKVLTSERLDAWVSKIENSKQFAIDTETTGKDSMTCDLVGVCLAVVEQGQVEACYIPVGHTDAACKGEVQLPLQEVLDAVAPMCASHATPKILQNAIYDAVVLGRYGVEFNNVDDTMWMSYVATAGSTGHGMDEIAELYLGHRTIKFGEVVSDHTLLPMAGFQDVALDHATYYAAEDAEVTLRLFFQLRKALKQKGLWTVYETIDRPLILAGADMKMAGVAISKKACAILTKEWSAKINDAAARLQQYAPGINPGSPAQVGHLLFETLGLPVLEKTDSGAPSTGIETLELLRDRHEAVDALVVYRKFSKLVGTYTQGLPEMCDKNTGRIHGNLNFTFTKTGRLSSSNPNLQNIPSPAKGDEGTELRKAFVAPRGYKLVAGDYSQIELRVLAHVTQDPVLCQAFHDGQDIHTRTAGEVWDYPYDEMVHVLAEDEDGHPLRGHLPEFKIFKGLRRNAKTINFGLVYGMSAYGLSHQLKIDEGTAQDFIDKYFAKLTGVSEWIENTREFARQNRYVDTIYGRRLYTNNMAGRRADASAERQGGNYVIQGSAADLIRVAMSDVRKNMFEFDGALILQVHDELLLEVKEEQAEAARTMLARTMATAGGSTIKWRVPILVDAKIGDNWAEAH
jgi:DNA polymerase-1